MADLEMDHLTRELLRALRGKRSQVRVSRQLGHRSNVVYAWESGRRAPSATDFFRLAALSAPDVGATVARFAQGRFAHARSPHAQLSLHERAGVAALLEALSADRSLVELAAAMGSDRTTLSRWLRGRTEPRLPELLSFVQVTSQRLVEFVGLFANPETLPSIQAAHAALLIQRRLAYASPASHAILRALEVEAVAAASGPAVAEAIAHIVGLRVAEAEQQLSALVAAGQVVRDGDGRYRLASVLTVDTQPDADENRKLKAHWAELALQRLRSADHSPDALLSYNLFAISERDFQRLRRMHIEYFERVRELVSESSGARRVVLMNLQLLPLEHDA